MTEEEIKKLISDEWGKREKKLKEQFEEIYKYNKLVLDKIYETSPTQ